jgi:hypothetical protein
MVIDPENWLEVEQVMEAKNHVLLQDDHSYTEVPPQPQLLLISTHASHGTSSIATFFLIISVGGKMSVSLVDNGNTNSFMDYSFASQLHLPITVTAPRVIKVAGGTLDSKAIISNVSYSI